MACGKWGKGEGAREEGEGRRKDGGSRESGGRSMESREWGSVDMTVYGQWIVVGDGQRSTQFGSWSIEHGVEKGKWK